MDNTIHEKISALTRRINELARQQTTISNQLIQLINELEALKQTVNTSDITAPAQTEAAVIRTIEQQEVVEAPSPVQTVATSRQQPINQPPSPARKSTTTFEEFIGKNVASKVGILVTIIGIFIGAKYAIDHNMVSSVVRVISGYTWGVVLVAVAIWLKKKYEAYSSVLMGGGLSVLYFITYIAFSFYQLIPQLAAFGLMLAFTAATVYAALLYNRVIIAHLAQVGAYAIPFLLSDHSGRYAVFFSYIAIINTGILVVSLRKYWKSLFYTAFALTWIIYLSWYFFSYSYPVHENIAWVFLGIFFLIFYATFLAYKIIKKERYGLHDVFILLSNAFIFYGIGYGLLNGRAPAKNFSGTFTLINAAIHLAVSQIIRRLQLADRALYYLLLGLVIVFCTIAVPVQLDGNWVTLLWTAEAVLVFLIGRTRQAAAYEKLGVGLAVLGFISLLQDWLNHANYFAFSNGTVQPFGNIMFATGLLVAAAQGTIIYYNRSKKYQSELPATSLYRGFYDYALPVLFLVTAYFVFQLEINGYFKQLEQQVRGRREFIGMWGTSIGAFGFIVLALYTIAFNIVIMIINRRWIRNKQLASFSLVFTALLMFVLLVQELEVVNKLAALYYHEGGLYFGVLHALIRYVLMAFTAALLFTGQKVLYDLVPEPAAVARKAWLLMVHTVILGFISAEYLCWTTISGAADNQYKLGLSIVWGVYALWLVVLGINKKLKHVRLAAIALFLITLIKLFLYDLAGSGTITKTISFISLGVILLLVSYLYNRYKEVLFGDGNE